MLVLRLSPKSFDICNSSAKSKMMQSGCSCRPDSGFMHLDKCKGLLAGQLPEPPQFPPSPHNLSSYQHMDLLETSIMNQAPSSSQLNLFKVQDLPQAVSPQQWPCPLLCTSSAWSTPCLPSQTHFTHLPQDPCTSSVCCCLCSQLRESFSNPLPDPPV